MVSSITANGRRILRLLEKSMEEGRADVSLSPGDMVDMIYELFSDRKSEEIVKGLKKFLL